MKRPVNATGMGTGDYRELAPRRLGAPGAGTRRSDAQLVFMLLECREARERILARRTIAGQLSLCTAAGIVLSVLILLTNDDGIHAPGLAAMERELEKLGDVYVVAPATEQSGVGHAVTYLSPLVIKEMFQARQGRGWAVEGSPADCVKIGIFEFCPRLPDLVVSGVNGGLNAGINVLYSGTVAAAIEGAFFGITSVAVSLEFDEQADFDRAALLARETIEQILEQKGPDPQLYNLNIPTVALRAAERKVRVAPMDLEQSDEQYEKRIDPRGRSYFWALSGPKASIGGHETDVSALQRGFVTLTPLDFDLTKRSLLAEMGLWSFELPKRD